MSLDIRYIQAPTRPREESPPPNDDGQSSNPKPAKSRRPKPPSGNRIVIIYGFHIIYPNNMQNIRDWHKHDTMEDFVKVFFKIICRCEGVIKLIGIDRDYQAGDNMPSVQNLVIQIVEDADAQKVYKMQQELITGVRSNVGAMLRKYAMGVDENFLARLVFLDAAMVNCRIEPDYEFSQNPKMFQERKKTRLKKCALLSQNMKDNILEDYSIDETFSGGTLVNFEMIDFDSLGVEYEVVESIVEEFAPTDLFLR
jgi:hypothetical protein